MKRITALLFAIALTVPTAFLLASQYDQKSYGVEDHDSINRGAGIRSPMPPM